jgi:hypothetical protein
MPQIIQPEWVCHNVEGAPNAIYSVDIHPDGSRFVTGGGGSIVHVSKRQLPCFARSAWIREFLVILTYNKQITP